MLKIYGNMLCKDCVQCREDLDRSGVIYEFLDIGHDLGHLKAFLMIRDCSPEFDDIRKTDRIGIPCIVTESGAILLDWEVYVSQEDS
jgi:glutaredoxin-related protein